MGATIQIVIAGTLILAWIWVLGRPLMARPPTAYDDFLARNPEHAPEPGTASVPSSAHARSQGFGRGVRRWWNRPAEVWRRQLLMASLIAAFVSFLLAVALRTTMNNLFLYLFGLMLTGLVIHLVIAARLGRRMLEDQRVAMVVAAASASKVRPGTLDIRAEQVGDQHPDPYTVAEHDDADSAFDRAADIASALEVEGAASIDEVDVVAGMIESEWGDGTDEVEVDPTEGIGDDPMAFDEPADTAPPAETDPPIDEGPPPDVGAADGIFRRAAVNEPGRGRRKATPIYIESQLDEDGDGPRAVNFP
ncbi:MAG: hypothetical protein AAGD35_13150 [Actinomycetota bacterium]